MKGQCIHGGLVLRSVVFETGKSKVNTHVHRMKVSAKYPSSINSLVANISTRYQKVTFNCTTI